MYYCPFPPPVPAVPRWFPIRSPTVSFPITPTAALWFWRFVFLRMRARCVGWTSRPARAPGAGGWNGAQHHARSHVNAAARVAPTSCSLSLPPLPHLQPTSLQKHIYQAWEGKSSTSPVGLHAAPHCCPPPLPFTDTHSPVGQGERFMPARARTSWRCFARAPLANLDDILE